MPRVIGLAVDIVRPRAARPASTWRRISASGCVSVPLFLTVATGSMLVWLADGRDRATGDWPAFRRCLHAILVGSC